MSVELLKKVGEALVSGPLSEEIAAERAAPKKRKPVFWTADDGEEHLTHTEADEALVEHVDGFLSPGCDTEKVVREEVGSVTLYGYARMEVTPAHLTAAAADLVERLVERFEELEGWGDSLFGEHEVLDEEVRERLCARIFDALEAERVAGHIVPWACEVVEERTLSVDEVLKQLRCISPEWFEPTEVSRG